MEAAAIGGAIGITAPASPKEEGGFFLLRAVLGVAASLW